MIILNNHNLKEHNTFGISSIAEYFVNIDSIESLSELLASDVFLQNKRFILGEGSNVLFSHDYHGLIIAMDIQGIKIIEESNEDVIIEAAAGTSWNEFVTYCLDNNYYGLENLALIPGKCGAAPVQNIGAYGVEQKDFFYSLSGINMATGEHQVINKEECEFGYRDSIFKKQLKDSFIVTAVQYKLSKTENLNLSYHELATEIEGITNEIPSARLLYDCVCKLRNSKLPNYKEQGNAGSFFKNPMISLEHLYNIRRQYPELRGSPNSRNFYKVSAGWLIEKCGWKGKSLGNAAVSSQHALILINTGSASGSELLELADKITVSVKEQFEISLEKEVLVL